MSLVRLSSRREPWQLIDGAWSRAVTVSSRLLRILRKLTAASPSDRYPSAVAALADLDRLRAGARLSLSLPRSPWLIAAAAVAMAGVGAGALATVHALRHGSDHAAELAPVAPGAPLPSMARPMPMPMYGSGTPLTPDELAELDADIDRLQAADPTPEVVGDVRAKLVTSDWMATQNVQGTILASRSPAFVPMLLKRAATDSHPASTQVMGAVFSMLTGQPMTDMRGLTPDIAAAEFRGWWRGARDTFTTDPCKMDRETRRAVERAIATRGWGGLGAALGRSRGPRDRSEVALGPGCAVMVPELLSMTDEPGLRYGVAAMLTTLRGRGVAHALDDVVTNDLASPAQRIVAISAIADAGEPVSQTTLIAMYATTQDTELRAALLRVMARGDAVGAVRSRSRSSTGRSRSGAPRSRCCGRSIRPRPCRRSASCCSRRRAATACATSRRCCR